MAAPFAAPLGSPVFTMYDAAGDPLSGGRVESYVAGTSTPLATYPTYADALAGTNPNTNPVILDSSGRGAIWLTNTLYKIVVKDAGGATIWTADNVGSALGFPQPYTTEWVPETTSVSYSSATSFLVNGVDATATYHAGRRVKVQVTAGTRYATVTSSSFAINTTVNLAIDSGLTLDAGLSTVQYGWNSYINPSYLDPRTAFTARLTANQTGFAASTKLAGWTVEQDSLSEWVAGSNRIVLSHPGYYLVNLEAEYADTGTNVDVTLQVSVSGSVVSQSRTRTSATASQIWSVSCHHLVRTTNTAGYVEAFFLGTANTTVQGTIGTRLTVTRIP